MQVVQAAWNEEDCWDVWTMFGEEAGVNKKHFACPFQDRQFQNPDRLTGNFRNFYFFTTG